MAIKQQQQKVGKLWIDTPNAFIAHFANKFKTLKLNNVCICVCVPASACVYMCVCVCVSVFL